MKTKASFAIIALSIFFFMVWLFRGQSLQVGFVAPFSGSEINRGVAVHKGLMVAVDEWNKASGFFNSQIQVHLSDTQSMIAEVEKSAEQLINEKKVKVLIGEVDDLRSKKLIDYALEKKYPLIIPVSEKIEIKDLSLGVTLTNNLLRQYGSILSAFIESELKLSNVVILKNISFDPENAIGQAFKKTFAVSSDRKIEEFLFESKNITQNIFYKELLQLEHQILIILSQPQESALMAASLRKQGYKGKIVFLSGFDNFEIRSVVDPDILGTYFLSGFNSKNNERQIQEFVRNYEAIHRQKPNTYSALGYDAGQVLIKFVQSNRFGLNSEKIIQQIEDLKKDNKFKIDFLTQASVYRIDAKEDTLIYPKK